MFLKEHVKGTGEVPTTPEDSELKEGGHWQKAKDYGMKASNYSAQEKYMHDMGDEMGLAVVPKQERRRERWTNAASRAALRHTQIHEKRQAPWKVRGRQAILAWRQRGQRANKSVPRILKDKTSSNTWTGIFGSDMPAFIQNQGYVKKQYTRTAKTPTAKPLLPFKKWPNPTKKGLSEAGYDKPMGLWSGLIRGPESSVESFLRGSSTERSQREERRKLVQQSFESGILQGVRRKGRSVGFHYGYSLAYPKHFGETVQGGLGSLVIPSVWESGLGVIPSHGRRMKRKHGRSFLEERERFFS